MDEIPGRNIPFPPPGEHRANGTRPSRHESGETTSLRIARSWWTAVCSAGRTLARQRRFLVVSTITLGLGVGANLLVFTIVNALWLRPRPIASPHRVVMIVGNTGGASGTTEDFFFSDRFLREHILPLQVFEDIAAQVATSGANAEFLPRIWMDGVAGPIESLAVTPRYFSVLGLPIMGRDFLPSDDQPGAAPVAIISDRLWRTTFRGRPEVLGATIQASPVPLLIIGVAPPGFEGARLGENAEIWIPRHLVSRVAAQDTRRDPPLLAIARLKTGFGLLEAQRGVAAIPSPAFLRYEVIPIESVFGSPTSRTLALRPDVLVFVASGTALLVLCGACATQISLLLVYYERRRREFAIRVALGCSIASLMRALVAELLGIAAIGALAALCISRLMLAVLPALSLPGGIDLTRIDLSHDWRVVSFSLVTALAAVVVAAIVPVRRCMRAGVVAELHHATGQITSSAFGVRKAILVIQVASTVILLVGAGLFVRTVNVAFTTRAGFDQDNVVFLEAQIRPSSSVSTKDFEARTATNVPRIRHLMEALRQLPGVNMVALGGSPIGLDQLASTREPKTVATVNDQRRLLVSVDAVGPEYIETIGGALLRGKLLSERDIVEGGEKPALVTLALANTLWPGASPLERPFVVGSRRYRVLGVIRDMAFGSFSLDLRAGVFEAAGVQQSARPMTLKLTLRTTPDASATADAVRRTVSDAFPEASRVFVETGRDVLARDLGRQRLGAWFFSGFGVVALLLGIGAVFVIVLDLSEARRREMAIRMALGDSLRHVTGMLVAAGLGPAILGLAVGLVASTLLGRWIESLLVGVGHLDSMTYIVVSALTSIGSVAAALVAASRIGRMTPTEALRQE